MLIVPGCISLPMPFDVRDFPGASAADQASDPRNRGLVAAWIFCVAGMILVMIALGGATRLTGSGLSIMEWAPIMGTLPPLSDAEWHRLFDLYRQIPQYNLVNDGFGLDGFKRIFWLEWIHRFWGRMMGVAFTGPLIWFWATRRLDRPIILRLFGLCLLGGMQGFVGWFMVRSGFFADATTVSPYRLVIHLALAVLLYGALLWTGLSLLPKPAPRQNVAPRGRRLIAAVCALIALTILAGGFVAGLRAGLDYNTFPLMDGRLIPEAYARLDPFLLNLTENIASVQFNHRLLASCTLILATGAAIRGIQHPDTRRWSIALGLAAIGQYSLGIATLLAVVPPTLGVAHQVGAILLLTAALGLLHRSTADRPVIHS